MLSALTTAPLHRHSPRDRELVLNTFDCDLLRRPPPEWTQRNSASSQTAHLRWMVSEFDTGDVKTRPPRHGAIFSELTHRVCGQFPGPSFGKMTAKIPAPCHIAEDLHPPQ